MKMTLLEVGFACGFLHHCQKLSQARSSLLTWQRIFQIFAMTSQRQDAKITFIFKRQSRTLTVACIRPTPWNNVWTLNDQPHNFLAMLLSDTTAKLFTVNWHRKYRMDVTKPEILEYWIINHTGIKFFVGCGNLHWALNQTLASYLIEWTSSDANMHTVT